MQALVNVIISTDSPLLCSRLITIFSELSHVNVKSVTKDLDEAESAISKSDVQVFVTAFHKIDRSIFRKLKEIKKENSSLIIIVLTNNLIEQYLTLWKNSGADYVFDQAFHLSKVIDILSELIYKNLLESLKSNKPDKLEHALKKL